MHRHARTKASSKASKQTPTETRTAGRSNTASVAQRASKTATRLSSKHPKLPTKNLHGARGKGGKCHASYDAGEGERLLGLMDYAINLQVDLSSSGAGSDRLDGSQVSALLGCDAPAGSRQSDIEWKGASGSIAALSKLVEDIDHQNSDSGDSRPVDSSDDSSLA